MKNKDDLQQPPWLKAMQNGSIGEARAKAFLLDRFWVLERSVDVDGADFIIQRRLTTQTLLDREAPRLGVVQVKFFGTDQTSQYVHRDYVLDRDGKPRAEFFLLCHSGSEEAQMTFLLNAEEISDNFNLSHTAEPPRYHIPSSKLDRHEVRNRRLALDRMENRLRLADFTTNRRFMSWVLPSPQEDLDGILPEYKEPVANSWGDIPAGFAELKQKARSALCRVEEAYNLLLEVADAADPLKAEKALQELSEEYRSGYGKLQISLPDDLDDEDFFYACKQHKLKVRQLKSDGLLDSFIEMRAYLQAKVTAFLEPHFPIDPNIVHRLLMQYDPNTFTAGTITSELIPAAEHYKISPELDRFGHVAIPWDPFGREVREISPGLIEAFWVPGRHGFTLKSTEPSNIDAFRVYSFSVYHEVMQFVYELKYIGKT